MKIQGVLDKKCVCDMIVTFHFNESPTIPRNDIKLCPANMAASLNFGKKIRRPKNER